MLFRSNRDPRLRYYLGARYLDDLNSCVGTAGFNYELTRKYSFSLFQQYDFQYEGGHNLATSATITRKWPRWYTSFTFTYDQATDDIALYLTLWPEGVPEVQIGSGRMSLLGRSDQN